MTLVDKDDEDAQPVTVWSLEMTRETDVVPAKDPAMQPHLMRADRPAPELSRFFYQLVGGPWHWVDRLGWSDARWLAWVDRPEQHLVTCWVDGVPAGYLELEEQGRSVELVYFGLAPSFIGRGLGGWLLTRALESAWAIDGTERVWLHTCSLDGPAALPNYERRGLRRFDEVTEWRRTGG